LTSISLHKEINGRRNLINSIKMEISLFLIKIPLKHAEISYLDKNNGKIIRFIVENSFFIQEKYNKDELGIVV